MAPQRSWQDIDELFDLALDQPAEKREAWIEANCEDPRVQSRLRELLTFAEDEEQISDTPGIAPAGGLQGPIFEEVAERLLGRADHTPGGDDDVSLRAGDKVGGYEIVELLGEGGMGRVDRARDLQLRREVAVKSLSPLLSLSPEGLRRFQREARMLATLNHPNIATIYELVEEGGHSYLVLEMVEGETLGERLKQGRFPLEAALDIARQLAGALREAHDKGIIHRDLKPGNVKLTPEGRVKVLDFGLAKFDPSSSASMVRAETGLSTNAGVVLGTVAYMSPEQAGAEPLDRRTDIWAFGCLLFEMLSGRRAFNGETGPDVLAAVLRDPVDWQALPDDTPPVLRDLIESCLTKEPEQRLADIAQAQPLLSDPSTLSSDKAARPLDASGETGSRLPWLIAALTSMAAIFGWWSAWREPTAPAAPRPTVRLSLDPGEGISLPDDYNSAFALSPDGTRLVFAGATAGGGERADGSSALERLYLRDLERLAVLPIPGTEGGYQPFFAPDGRTLGFFADRKLFTVDLSLGDPGQLRPESHYEIGGNPRGASWGPDGTIVIAPSQTSGLMRLSANGSELTPFTTLDADAAERSHRWPAFSRDGRWVLLTVQDEGRNFDQARIEAAFVETGRRHVVARDGAHPRWADDRRVIFSRAGRLHAVTIDPDTVEPQGEPFPVLEGVQYDNRNGGTQMAMGGGHLIYVPGPTDAGRSRLDWVERSGQLRPVLDETRLYRQPRLSRDSQIAVVVGDARDSDLWLVDPEDGQVTVRASGRELVNPVWDPTGRHITMAERTEDSWHLVTFEVATDRETELVRSSHRLVPGDWSPDGRTLIFQERRPETGWDLRTLRVTAGGEPDGAAEDLLATPFNEANPQISGSGHWLAYESDELDAVVDIYVRPFGWPGVKTRISNSGGRLPTWGRTGELIYWRTSDSRLMLVRHDETTEGFVREPTVSVWDPEAGPVDTHLLPSNPRGFDVDRANGRLLALEDMTPRIPAGARKAIVVLDWVPGLASLGPTGNE